MRTHALPSLKVHSAEQLAREAAKAAAEQRLVRASAESGWSSCSASGKSIQGKVVGRSGGLVRERELPCARVRGDSGRRSGRRKPEKAVSSATRAKRSSYSASLRRVHGRVTYKKKDVLYAVIEAKSSPARPEDLSTK